MAKFDKIEVQHGGILRESNNAVLVGGFDGTPCNVWIPKSQLIETEFPDIILIPEWLYDKKREEL